MHGALCHSEGNRGKPTRVSILLLTVERLSIVLKEGESVGIAIIQQVRLTYPSGGDGPSAKPRPSLSFRWDGK